MRANKAQIFIVSAALFLGACAMHKPIYNVPNGVVTSAKPLDMAQVRGAIIAAGAGLGWEMQEVSPGLIEGTLKLRTHIAIVSIAYTTTTYSIKYKSSTNLDEKDGVIHKNYNGWIENLDKAIRVNLATR